MSTIKPEHLNPFLISAVHVFQQVCQDEPKIGQVTIASDTIDGNYLFIIFGVTGEMTGQVFLIFDDDAAKAVASRMMFGMPVEQVDDMAKSALSELGNMIMGNAATILSDENVMIDITPPALGVGTVKLSAPNTRSLEVPMTFSGGHIRICFMLKFQ